MLDLGVELAIHCGDITTPEIISLFRRVPTHFVFGNWDRPAQPLCEAIHDCGGTYYPTHGLLEVAGKKLAWCHSHMPGQLSRLESSGEYDFVFYGHTHRAESHLTGKTLVVNPGAMTRVKVKTFALVDLSNAGVEWVKFEKGAKRDQV